MSSIPENIILKSFQDAITDEEAKILNKWLKEKKKNVEYYCHLEEIWYSNEKLNEDAILSGWNRLLTDIEKQPSQKQMSITTRKHKNRAWFRYIAAAFIGGLLASFVWKYFLIPETIIQEKDILIQNIIYNRTDVQSIAFPDSSMAWINGPGKISYPNCFDNRKRTVLLEGKAYFDIRKDAAKPFIIYNENIDIEVIGTELFADFSPGNQLKVILISGSLNVHSKNKQGKDITTSLLPGQQADINKITGEIAISTAETDYYTAWKDGTYRFKDVPLEKIAALVSHHYNIDIQVATTLKTKRFTGRITSDDNIKDVMEIISKSFPVQYKVAGNKVIIKPR